MGLNLSRGEPIKYYSSDRITQIVGNGLVCLIDEKTQYRDFFNNSEMVFYKNVNDFTALKLGFAVIDYIMNDDSMESFDTDYPKGSGRYPVSFFPSGVDKTKVSAEMYDRWMRHISKVATKVGYKLVDFLDAEKSLNESLISEVDLSLIHI